MATRKPKPPTDYQAALRDPRWQKKRLEILNEHEFTCQACGATEQELHVHHSVYTDGLAPWEYEDEQYRVWCSTCHDLFHKTKDSLFCLMRETTDPRFLASLEQTIDLLSKVDPETVGFLNTCLLKGYARVLIGVCHALNNMPHAKP